MTAFNFMARLSGESEATVHSLVWSLKAQNNVRVCYLQRQLEYDCKDCLLEGSSQLESGVQTGLDCSHVFSRESHSARGVTGRVLLVMSQSSTALRDKVHFRREVGQDINLFVEKKIVRRP